MKKKKLDIQVHSVCVLPTEGEVRGVLRFKSGRLWLYFKGSVRGKPVWTTALCEAKLYSDLLLATHDSVLLEQNECPPKTEVRSVEDAIEEMFAIEEEYED